MRASSFFRFLSQCCLIFLTLSFEPLFAHGEGRPAGDEWVFTLKVKDIPKAIKALAGQDLDVLGIDVQAKKVQVLGTQEQLERTIQGINVTVVSRTLHDRAATPDEKYLSHAEITDALANYAKNFSQLMSYESVGKSVEGRDIWAAHLRGARVPGAAARPAVLFNAMHHAREVMTPEVAMDTIDTLLNGYASNPTIRKWMDEIDIWVVPMVNPDGNNLVWTEDNMWRKNVRGGYGVDINRNYPFQWGKCNGSSGSTWSETYRGPSAGSEPETQALMNIVSRIRPVIDISYHSYSELVLYPYGCEGQKTPTHDVVAGIGSEIAKRLKVDKGSGNYTPGTSWEVLYAVDGGDIDWMYHDFGVIPYVIEINGMSQGFQPAYSWRQPTVEKLRNAWQYVLNRVGGSGIRGHIVAQEGVRVSGEVVLSELRGGKVTGKATTHSIKPDGSFHILLNPGRYRVEITANGHKETRDVTVKKTREDLEISLL